MRGARAFALPPRRARRESPAHAPGIPRRWRAPRRVHAASTAVAPLLRHQRLVAREKFLDLHRVVGERFGGRIDRGQAAADDDDRQAQLHVGDRIVLRRAGELQRHQEIGRGAHAVGETVRQIEHRRPARAGSERDVIEAERERIFARSSVPPKRTPP